MIGSVAKIPGVALPFFGVANFKSSSIGSGRCFEVAHKRRQSLRKFWVRFIFTKLCGNLLIRSRQGSAFLRNCSNHEDDVFTDGGAASTKRTGTVFRYLDMLERGRIHEQLSIWNYPFFKTINLETNPLQLFFRLLDASVGGESVLNTLRLTKNALSGCCENKEMVQLGVDGSDVEGIVRRIKLKDPFEVING